MSFYYLGFDLIGRRLFYIPATLNDAYIDLFKDKYLYLSYGWYNPFIDYTYNVSPQYLVGDYYWNDIQTSANNGLVSSGYMNFGNFGVIFYSILLGLIFSNFKDKLSDKYNAVSFVFVFVFTTSFFITSLLSHGIILLVITINQLLTYDTFRFSKKLL